MKLLDLFQHADGNTINEAPIGDFGTFGDFSDGDASMPDQADRRAVTAEPIIKRIKQAWENTPFTFNLFFVNIKGMEKFVEQGYVSPMTVKRELPDEAARVIAGTETDAITVVFTNNLGVGKISFTPWIIAHRISHAMVMPNNTMDRRQGMQNPEFSKANRYVQRTFEEFSSLMSRLGKSISSQPQGITMRAFYETLGTMKSARDGNYERPNEFLHEVFAQYLLSGGIKFNKVDQTFLNTYAEKTGGTPVDASKPYAYKDIKEFNEFLSEYETTVLPDQYNRGLQHAQGKIIFM
jgi:hypothetical protein